MRRPPSRHTRRLFFAALFAAALCCALNQRATAQSTDIAYPAPVFSNEITGRIAPRDLGDSRLTRHFYLFRGTEGDVTVTVESALLNGDVDLFVAKTQRPLLKVTMFGGTSATRATKSVYLRREETLLLRVEARAAGDAEGSYRVLLGGSFAPAPPELASQQTPAETPTPAPEPARRPGTRRVTSTGARIDEPPAAVAEAAPTPEPTPAEAAPTEETAPATRTPARTTRRGRSTRGGTNRRRAPAAQPTPSEPSATSTDDTAARRTEETPKPADETPTPPAPAATSRRRAPRNTSRRRAPTTTPSDSAATSSTDAATPATPPPTVTITRLVILTKDGQTLERAMDGVRRVTIENNQVVVTLKDGKVLRTPLANVEKMSIEP